MQKANGHSLESYYAELPSELRGYVELVYDYYNRPTVRFFESLLYESDYFDKSLHSLRLFRQTHDNSRPFFMNTPRLPAKGQIRWEVPFESPLIDELFKLDSAPKPLGHLREMLDLNPADEEVLLPLLSADPYCARKKREGSGVYINYLGHACVLIEWNGMSILTDPCIGLKPVKGGVERFTYKDLPERLDYVLITHNHHDHFCLESLLRLRHKIDCLVVPRSFGISLRDFPSNCWRKKLASEMSLSWKRSNLSNCPTERLSLYRLWENTPTSRMEKPRMLFAPEVLKRCLPPIQTALTWECISTFTEY